MNPESYTYGKALTAMRMVLPRHANNPAFGKTISKRLKASIVAWLSLWNDDYYPNGKTPGEHLKPAILDVVKELHPGHYNELKNFFNMKSSIHKT